MIGLKKPDYYTLDEIQKLDCDYNIILGLRANGKSYAVKKHCVKEAIENDNLFVYVRRTPEECMSSRVQQYFMDCPVSELTNDEYTGIAAKAGKLHLVKYDGVTGREMKGKLIGYYLEAGKASRYKSLSYPSCTNIIFEEFTTDSGYLPNEPERFQQIVSTVFRNVDGKVYLIGNTITRVCPYFYEWKLENVLTQEMGTIDVYNFTRTNEDGDEYTTKIAVQYCKSIKTESHMFFGKASDNITVGLWETKDSPHLPRPYNEYTKLYEMLYEYQAFQFCLQLLVNDNGGMITFVYPWTRATRNIQRKISDKFSEDPLTTINFYDNINAERKIKDCLKNNKVCYSDNLTAHDFEQCLLNRKEVIL